MSKSPWWCLKAPSCTSLPAPPVFVCCFCAEHCLHRFGYFASKIRIWSQGGSRTSGVSRFIWRPGRVMTMAEIINFHHDYLLNFLSFWPNILKFVERIKVFFLFKILILRSLEICCPRETASLVPPPPTCYASAPTKRLAVCFEATFSPIRPYNRGFNK